MTRKGRAGSTTDHLGRFYTDVSLAAACLEVLPIPVDCTLADTSAGSGHWLEAAILDERRRTGEAPRKPRRRLYAMDLDPMAAALDLDAGPWRSTCGDFLDLQAWPKSWPAVLDWSVGNPPYSLLEPVIGPDGLPERHTRGKRKGQIRTRSTEAASAHVIRGLLAARNVALVLRADFLGTARWERYPWLEDHLVRYWRLIPRPSFTGRGTGTDGAEYVLAWWARDHHGGPSEPPARLRWKGDAMGPELHPLLERVGWNLDELHAQLGS